MKEKRMEAYQGGIDLKSELKSTLEKLRQYQEKCQKFDKIMECRADIRKAKETIRSKAQEIGQIYGDGEE